MPWQPTLRRLSAERARLPPCAGTGCDRGDSPCSPQQPRRRRRAAGIAVAALALRSDSTPQHAAIPAKNVASPANNAASTTGAAPATTTAPAAPRRSVQSDGASGAALNDAGFGHMQAGDYATALPLLERAVAALRGSGSLTEAYASYNLAFTRRSLGRCDGVLELLDRSAEVQGARKEIDRLRRESVRACGSVADGDQRGGAQAKHGKKAHGKRDQPEN